MRQSFLLLVCMLESASAYGEANGDRSQAREESPHTADLQVSKPDQHINYEDRGRVFLAMGSQTTTTDSGQSNDLLYGAGVDLTVFRWPISNGNLQLSADLLLEVIGGKSGHGPRGNIFSLGPALCDRFSMGFTACVKVSVADMSLIDQKSYNLIGGRVGTALSWRVTDFTDFMIGFDAGKYKGHDAVFTAASFLLGASWSIMGSGLWQQNLQYKFW